MRWITTIFIADLLLWVAATVDGGVHSWLQSWIASPQEHDSKVHSRSKRSLYNFQSVIHCFQPWSNALSHYGDYGCYCGYRGHGQPLDDTDKCCFYHDNCYDKADHRAETLSEKTVGSYFSNYNFECIGNNVTCRADLNTKYQQSICECDRQAGECFLRNRKSYSSKLFNIDTGKYCGEKPNFDDIYLGTHTLSKLYSCNLLPEQDSCCVDKGYNSVYKLCCGGNLRSKSSSKKETIRCCGNRFYDPRLHFCCYGVLHPNALHMKCCGVMGAKVDTTIAKCIDGKPVLKESAAAPLKSTVLL